LFTNISIICHGQIFKTTFTQATELTSTPDITFFITCSRPSQRAVDILVNHTTHDPSDAKSWFLLGDAYTARQQHKEAIKAFHNCFKSGESDEEAALAMYKAANGLATLGKYDDAIVVLSKGMTRHPNVAELPWFTAFLSYKVGRHQAAADWARLAITHGCYIGICPKRSGFENPFARYEGPYDTLQWSLRALGDDNGALVAENHMKLTIKKRQRAIASSTQDGPHDISKSHAQLIFTPINGSKPRIGLGFTTAKRPETFKRTYLSFRCAPVQDTVFPTPGFLLGSLLVRGGCKSAMHAARNRNTRTWDFYCCDHDVDLT
jgi:tetratricopeptide (TPR) repeat protein